MMGEAQRLDIPCIGTGTFLASMGLPAIYEDGQAGAAQAVRHLVEMGHRRLGFVQITTAMPFIFHRRQGFLDGLSDAGIEPDPAHVLWLDSGDPNPKAVEQFISRYRVTALLCGCTAAARHVGALMKDDHLRIPQDVSVATFDQHPEATQIFNGTRPSIVALPLFAMGRRLAELARDVADHRPIAQITKLPCEWMPGDTVQPVNSGE
jgi:LacI family transcriptional regulator